MFAVFLISETSAFAQEPQVYKLYYKTPVTLQGTNVQASLTKLSIDLIDSNDDNKTLRGFSEHIWGEIFFQKGRQTKTVAVDGAPYSFEVFDLSLSVTAMTRNWIEINVEPALSYGNRP